MVFEKGKHYEYCKKLNITIGEGRPKICVPIVGKTRKEILKEASTFSHCL